MIEIPVGRSLRMGATSIRQLSIAIKLSRLLTTGLVLLLRAGTGVAQPAAPSIDTEMAKQYFAEMKSVSDADLGSLLAEA